MIKHVNGIGWVLALSLVIGAGPLAAPPAAPQGVTLVPESNDFATRVLRDPWDMSSLSDVSAYLNDSGQRSYLQNIQVANGLFSAASTSIADANFALLFPGYQNAIKTGKDGALNPINSAEYHCLYIAMDVQGNSGNQGQVFWFSDDKLNTGAQWGASPGFNVTNNRWTLYKLDLASLGALVGTGWSNRSNWQGLRLDPTGQANTNFQIDWARLTNCSADNATFSWPQNGNLSTVRLRPAGTARDIQIHTLTGGERNAGTATLDVQGVQPGTYTVGLFNGGGSHIEDAYNQLVVNQAPIADFVRPSFTSGADFASQAGNPWDFSTSGDVQSAPGMQSSTHDSLFDMTTQSSLSPVNGADPQIFLHASQAASSSTYRYVSFRLYTEWAAPWANVPDGMVARWIWGILGASGQPTNRCYLVSHDIPFDVGWHVYNIDLWDGYNGAPLEKTPDCPANTPSWHSSPPVLVFRFDPNENITVPLDPITNGGPFHQLLDWIRLTAMDQVSQGAPYELQVHLNRPAGDVTSVAYYYTTDRSAPTQSLARHYATRSLPGPFRFYLPLVQASGGALASGDVFPSADLKFMWDTAGVSPNTYYLCAVVTIAPNTATYCSDAPLQVR